MTEDENEFMPTATLLKFSKSERNERKGRPLITGTKIQTTQTSSTKEDSVTRSPLLSSSLSSIKKIDNGKNAPPIMTLEGNKSKKATTSTKSAHQGCCYFYIVL
ncbi:hypothetical protein LOAG_17502 [Loa loa]|nr:hypothetical protein LOAG_17502 [Loa loa]EJD75326.1 hypothetical protein LOAG_17502 [Loa loa]